MLQHVIECDIHRQQPITSQLFPMGVVCGADSVMDENDTSSLLGPLNNT